MKQKIINDPVYGFIHFTDPEVLRMVDEPSFQRLRHIRQMALAHLVYPGAVHTRFHHSLGAYHLMTQALQVLRSKGVSLHPETERAAQLAILLHDIGHGPFSHALEYVLAPGLKHETLSLILMEHLNTKYDGLLDEAISIFKGENPQRFLHQLLSSQLDMDRLDYLSRDSFFTGVSEGVIGYDRIIHMLTVKDGELMIEEKGVHSVEKFIIARRLMYWQVYLHKAVLGAERLLIHIFLRAMELIRDGVRLFATPALHFVLHEQLSPERLREDPDSLRRFCMLDDNDVMASIKVWQDADDFILSTCCKMLINRKLYKIKINSTSLDAEYDSHKEKVHRHFKHLSESELSYFVFKGKLRSDTYSVEDERIKIALKDGRSCDIMDVDDPVIDPILARSVEKNYLCYYPVE